MAYTPNTWKSGDIVTSAKLNNIEKGIADGGVLIITESVVEGVHTLDKKYEEITANSLPILVIEGTAYLPTFIGEDEGDYVASFWTFGLTEPLSYVSETTSGYPSFEENPAPNA